MNSWGNIDTVMQLVHKVFCLGAEAVWVRPLYPYWLCLTKSRKRQRPYRTVIVDDTKREIQCTCIQKYMYMYVQLYIEDAEQALARVAMWLSEKYRTLAVPVSGTTY